MLKGGKADLFKKQLVERVKKEMEEKEKEPKK